MTICKKAVKAIFQGSPRRALHQILTIVAFCLLATSSANSYSATDDISKLGMGGRALGMGRANVAVVEDVNSIFINPAGLIKTGRFQFTSMYTSLFDGELNYYTFAVLTPTRLGTFAFGFIGTGVGQIISPSPTSLSYFDYYDRLFLASYCFDKPLDIWGGRVYTGATAKILAKGFSDPVGVTGQGVDLDLGMRYEKSGGETAFGLTLKNMLPTQMMWRTGATEDIPLMIKAGVAQKLFGGKVLSAFDVDLNPGRAVPSTFHAGVEYNMNNCFFMRAGADQDIKAGDQTMSANIAFGLGVYYDGLKLDYAYHTYAPSIQQAAHFISMSYAP